MVNYISANGQTETSNIRTVLFSSPEKPLRNAYHPDKYTNSSNDAVKGGLKIPIFR